MKPFEIHTDIGPAGCSAHDVQLALDAGHRQFDLHSEGGSTDTGIAIGELLNQAGATVFCHTASSAAVPVLVAGRQRIMAQNGWILLHPPWRCMAGGADELRAAADSCDAFAHQIAQRLARYTYLGFDAALAMIQAGIVLDAEAAYKHGFIDEIGEASDRAKPKPQAVVDGIEREAMMLRDRTLSEEHRAAHQRATADSQAVEAVAPETRRIAGDHYGAGLVEAFATPDTLASAFGIQYGARRRALRTPSSATQPEPFWRCLECGSRNFTPPSINRRAADCAHCKPN